MKSGFSLLPTLRSASPRHDLLAALSLAAIAIPEQLATARLAGLPATQGLIVFAVASVMMLLVSRSATLSVGADSTIAPLIGTTLAAGAAVHGDAALLAGMVGALLLAVYAMRLEWIANLLSKAVVGGMLAGIAVHILIGRLPIAFGLDLPPANPPDTLALLLHHAGEARLAPFLMASGIAAVCIAGSQIRKHFPAPLLALATAVAVAAVFDPGASIFPRTEALSGNAGLAWPSPDPANMAALLPVALSIAFLCLAQTAVVLRSGRHDSAETRRNAFGAVGIANIAVACIGGFGVNSSPPRTQLLRDSEAHSQLAGFGAALIGVLLVLFGAGLIRALPSAALAGVLIYIAYHLFTNAALEELIRRSPREGFLALATAALIIVMPLGIGLPVAILLSLLHASLPLFHAEVVELRNVPGTTIWWHQPASEHAKAGSSEPLVLGLTSPINFANAAGIVGRIRGTVAACPAPPTLLVLECAGVLAVDLSGADLLMELIRDLRARSIPVAIARLESDEAQQDMVRNGLLAAIFAIGMAQLAGWARSGAQVAASNVIVYFSDHQRTDIVEDSTGATSVRIIVNGAGRAWFFRDGKLTKGYWQTDGTRPPYFSTEDGEPYALKPPASVGKSSGLNP